jgi:hypothetical protein
MGVNPLDDDETRALDHDYPARGGAAVRGVSVAEHHVAGHRAAPHHDSRFDPLRLNRRGGSYKTGDQRPGDGGSHKTLMVNGRTAVSPKCEGCAIR